MQHLTPPQMAVLERAFESGFRPLAIPPYENVLCLRRGEYAAVLSPVTNGGLRLLAPPTLLVDGNLSVKLKRGKGEVFVWKKTEVEATAERLEELAKFKQDISEVLEQAAAQ